MTGIEANHKPLTEARKGMEVCIKIEPVPGEAPKMYGRHFDHNDLLVSKVKEPAVGRFSLCYFVKLLKKCRTVSALGTNGVFRVITR